MLTFSHQPLCAAASFSFCFSGEKNPSTAADEASTLYLDLFTLFLIASALLFFPLQSTVPPPIRALRKLSTPFLVVFVVTCDALLTGDSPAGAAICANCLHAFVLFLAGLAFLFARVCAGVDGVPSVAVLIGFILVRLGTAVFFYRAYPIQWNIDGADFNGCFDLQQFQLRTAAVVIMWAHV